MNAVELIENALASVDQGRVAITGIESAEIERAAVGGLTHLVTELVDNALAFSGPEEKVSITGVFDRGDYVISISDNGVGIPEKMITALNQVLADSTGSSDTGGPTLGIAMVARLAARYEISVRLVPAVPGTTARVTVPSRLLGVSPASEAPGPAGPTAEPTPLTHDEFGPGHVTATTDSARPEAEAFLNSVFGPIRGQSVSRPPMEETRSNGNGHVTVPPAPPETSTVPESTASALQTRVPGENFAVDDDDPSIISGEGAIDIRQSLTRYDEGRRAAADADVADLD